MAILSASSSGAGLFMVGAARSNVRPEPTTTERSAHDGSTAVYNLNLANVAGTQRGTGLAAHRERGLCGPVPAVLRIQLEQLAVEVQVHQVAVLGWGFQVNLALNGQARADLAQGLLQLGDRGNRVVRRAARARRATGS